MSGKLAAMVGAKLGGEVIEGGARVASGAIQGAATIAGSTIEAMGSTLGGALQGMLTQPPVTNVNVSYGGSVTSSGTPLKKPDPALGQAPKKISVNSSMSMEQLLTVAVDILSSIDTNLKNQYIASAHAARIKSAEERERKIENPMGIENTSKTEDISQDQTKSNIRNIAGNLLKAGGLLAALKVATMDTSELEKLGEYTKKFADNFGWLFDVAFGVTALGFLRKLFKGAGKTGLASLLEGPLKMLGVAITSPVAIAGGIASIPGVALWGMQKSLDQAHGQAQSDLSNLEKTWGMKAIVNSQGVTVGYEIKGKKYRVADLPPEYKNILTVYGPGDKRGGTYDRSKALIEKNQSTYDALRVGGGQSQVSGETPSGKAMDGDPYNTIYGHGRYTPPNKKLIEMTIGEVLDYQKNILAKETKADSGSVHTPVGAYQMVRATLEGQAKKLYGDDFRNKLFTAQVQDELAKDLWNAGKGHGHWATMKDRDYRGTSFESAKGTIISRETGGSTAEGSTSSGADLSSAGDGVVDQLSNLLNIAKGLGQTDSKIKPSVTSEAPNNEKYRELYQKNLEAETAMVAGIQKKKDQAAAVPSIVTSDGALRALNGGTLDVINPNYNLSENSILSQYISFFGYKA